MDRPDTNNLRLLAEDMEHDADHVIIKKAISYIDHLEARIKELEAANAWQPIETAPKDGTPILVYVHDEDFSFETGVFISWFDCDQWLFEGPNPIGEITHWLPLPSEPQS